MLGLCASAHSPPFCLHAVLVHRRMYQGSCSLPACHFCSVKGAGLYCFFLFTPKHTLHVQVMRQSIESSTEAELPPDSIQGGIKLLTIIILRRYLMNVFTLLLDALSRAFAAHDLWVYVAL
jgi:hypothetical protein